VDFQASIGLDLNVRLELFLAGIFAQIRLLRVFTGEARNYTQPTVFYAEDNLPVLF
jgi:hypothetical protein